MLKAPVVTVANLLFVVVAAPPVVLYVILDAVPLVLATRVIAPA